MIGPADLVRPPRGQAFALIEGDRLYNLRLPLSDAGHDPMMPEDLAAVAEDMSSRYVRVTPGEFDPGLGWAVGPAPVPGEPDWLRNVVAEGKGGGP